MRWLKVRRRLSVVLPVLGRVPWRALELDGLFIGGTLLVAAGIREVFPPAAPMFVGLMLLGLFTVAMVLQRGSK